MLQPNQFRVPNLLEDPTIQDYLNGIKPHTQISDANGVPFDPNQIYPEDQQRVADPVLPADQVASVVPTPAQPQKITSILDLIRANEPVQDPTLDARYKKAAMLDSLGQAFGNLAGAVGVGIGATVPKLPVDNNIARLYGARDTEKQRYLQQKRDWDRQMLQGAIQEMGMSAQERKDKEAADRWNKDYAFKVAKAKDDYEIAFGKAKSVEEQQKITNDFKKKDLELQAERNRISLIRANKPSASETANDPNKTIYTFRDPNTNELKQFNSADFQTEFYKATNNKSTDDIRTIMAPYQNNTFDGQKQIVTTALMGKAKADKDLADRAKFMVGSADMDKKPQVYPSPTGKPLTAEQLGNQSQPTPPVQGTITGPAVGSHAQQLTPFEQWQFDKTTEGQKAIEEKKKADIKAFAERGRPSLDTTVKSESTSHVNNIEPPQTLKKRDWVKEYKRSYAR